MAIPRLLAVCPGETTPDGEFFLETVPCMGLCATAPNVCLNDRRLSSQPPEELARRLVKLKDRGQRESPSNPREEASPA